MARKKKTSPGNRLVAYYRYSGGSQQTEQSIEGQRRDCEAYARQHGLTIVHEYIDRHISGRGVESRLAFQQMIADSSKHLFDLVICWKTDRFARNRYDSAVYKKKLRDNGVRILYAAESSVEGPEGIILEGLMESLAEYYSAELDQMIPSRTTVRLGIFLFFGSRRFGKIKINKHFRVCDLDAIYKGINDPAVIILGTFIRRDKELLQ